VAWMIFLRALSMKLISLYTKLILSYFVLEFLYLHFDMLIFLTALRYFEKNLFFIASSVLRQINPTCPPLT
jgi:hypothetical protein